jgi:hypothetical protein
MVAGLVLVGHALVVLAGLLGHGGGGGGMPPLTALGGGGIRAVHTLERLRRRDLRCNCALQGAQFASHF